MTASIRCPQCGTINTRIVKSDQSADGYMRWRVVECGNYHRFRTSEMPERALAKLGMPRVVAAREKLARGVERRKTAARRTRAVAEMLKQSLTQRQMAEALGITQSGVRVAIARLKKQQGAQQEAGNG